MKQFVLLVVFIVVVVGGVAAFAFWRANQIQSISPAEARDLTPAALRELLAKRAGLSIPASASDVHGCEYTLVGHWVAARFDVPTAEISAWLAGDEKLAKTVEGKAGAELHDEMTLCSTWVSRPWWDLPEVSNATCGSSQGARQTPAGEAKWRVRTCLVKAPQEKTQVYLVYSDDMPVEQPSTRPAK